MKVITLTQKEYDNWNVFVKQSPQGTIFSNTGFLISLDINFKILAIKDEQNKILAGIVLPKNEINTFSNPMLTKYFGILFSPNNHISHKTISKQYKIMELLIQHLKKIKSFDYYFHYNFNNWIPFYWNNFSQQTRYTYKIFLKDKSIEQIYSSFHGNLKNDIRNAIKANLTFEKNIEFESFFSIINKTFIRQGSKAPFSKNKLLHFLKEGTNNNFFKTFGIRNKNHLIAVCGIVYDNKSSYLLLNGIDIDKQVRGANAFLLYETIKYFKEKKLLYYDFEGSMLPGVEQFYRRFGGELTPYYKIWNDNFFNYIKNKAKKYYKKLRYGR